ncbi:MAG: hypothetical protein AVDCRST_MAG64-4416, partial [uncultured Phycisphaerae bacterium]
GRRDPGDPGQHLRAVRGEDAGGRPAGRVREQPAGRPRGPDPVRRGERAGVPADGGRPGPGGRVRRVHRGRLRRPAGHPGRRGHGAR